MATMIAEPVLNADGLRQQLAEARERAETLAAEIATGRAQAERVSAEIIQGRIRREDTSGLRAQLIAVEEDEHEATAARNQLLEHDIPTLERRVAALVAAEGEDEVRQLAASIVNNAEKASKALDELATVMPRLADGVTDFSRQLARWPGIRVPDQLRLLSIVRWRVQAIAAIAWPGEFPRPPAPARKLDVTDHLAHLLDTLLTRVSFQVSQAREVAGLEPVTEEE